jgi:hypothetical protein
MRPPPSLVYTTLPSPGFVDNTPPTSPSYLEAVLPSFLTEMSIMPFDSLRLQNIATVLLLTVIISDRGPQFTSNVFNGIFDAIGVKHRMSTAYHPQTDGQTEHYNQELEAYLCIYCAYKPDEWSNKLSLAQFAHNARTHEAIKQSPFQLMYGTKPVALPEVSEKTNSPVANDRINQLYKTREEALAAHDLARVKMMERTTNCTKPFKVNDQVWLESKNLKIPYQSRKLAPKREGPFKIKEVLGPVTY